MRAEVAASRGGGRGGDEQGSLTECRVSETGSTAVGESTGSRNDVKK